ncbi:hypothetical protein DC31_07780 [Microbacterium sp. CH12i]|uniref:hypothetical protein n=1 Tax=Microbacterium sp. CH12i TaxID=1479651 RepID=UPI00046202D8|nr:hypothetical protein [Microbacterium sp. CH12i]KDA06929.1 hypothetical protein DC31_07780 [Microbacterium sp. CH12i]
MTEHTHTKRGVKLAEKAILGFIAGAAAAIAIVDLVALVVRVSTIATSEEVTVYGIPLMDFSADRVAAASPQVSSAYFESLTLTASGLGGSVRGLLITAAILSALVAIGVCAVVAWLCLRVFIGRPFVRSATWGIGIASILVVAGGLGGLLFNTIANAEIAETLGLSDAGLPVFLAVLDFTPLGWGLALAVVAGAFEIGQRMQRDTEGWCDHG